MQESTPLSVAVITGGHSYDVPHFHDLFRQLDGIVPYIQHMDDFASSSEAVRHSYDAVVFYSMFIDGPVDDGLPWHAGHPLTALSGLGTTGQGIVILHHAVLAYPQWPAWAEIVGIADREFGYYPAEMVDTQIALHDHPITQFLLPWTMTDETYTMANAGPDSEILLTYDHPKSMRTIAWTRRYRASRVFCYVAGHDNDTWQNGNFQEVLRRGICWSADKV